MLVFVREDESMGRMSKLRAKVLSGGSDGNIAFSDLCGLLVSHGFTERVKGDHHIFTHPGIEEIVNIQPRKGKAKPYQVRQVREILMKYGMGGPKDDQI